MVRRVDGMQRRFVATVGIFGIVQDREDFEILFMCDRIILMRMALGASHRCAHPNRKCRIHAIDHRGVAELFVISPTLAVGHRIAMKRGRDQLFVSRIGQQVTG